MKTFHLIKTSGLYWSHTLETTSLIGNLRLREIRKHATQNKVAVVAGITIIVLVASLIGAGIGLGTGISLTLVISVITLSIFCINKSNFNYLKRINERT